MIREEHISDMNAIMRILSEQAYDEKIKRNRSSFIYRGMPNARFHLETSIRRNCKHKQFELEASILRNFTKYAAIDHPELNQSVWSQLILGQHHGLPTRLLDWTFSPMTALHFSTSGEDISKMNKHDSILWKLDSKEIKYLLPEEYRAVLKRERATFFTVDLLEEVARDLKEYDADMGAHSMVLIEPPSLEQRIANQYSYFSIIPNEMTDIEAFLNTYTKNTVKYIIDKKLRWRVRDMLDQMNINERMIYPGLDGLSQWLKRHYYVKER